jgi:predicted  nucleic acid-binding Zn-ribbon protein
MAYAFPAIEAERKELLDLLRNIEFGISKLSLSSGSARKDLYEIRTRIEDFQDKFETKGFSREELNEILMEKDHAMVACLYDH